MNWNELYNKIFKLINEQGSNYFSGERFISLIREVEADFPDYWNYIKQREANGQSTVRKDFFRDIFLSLNDDQKLDFAKRVERETHSPLSKTTQDLYFLIYNTLPELTNKELTQEKEVRNLFTDLFSQKPITENSKIMEKSKDPRKVFVVHGRNGAARNALFDLLRAIGLHPIEWSEAVIATGRGAPYIGDILDVAFSEAQAIVVLFTPDDIAKLQDQFVNSDDDNYEKELTPQARPNVIFEAGMAIGRNPDRTIFIELGKLRPFSDIYGRHVIRLNNSSPRRQELATRLRTAGCAVNLDGTDWHYVGDFEKSIETSKTSTLSGKNEVEANKTAFQSRSSNLRIKKTFTDRERDNFENEAFEYIANFFDSSLQELKKTNSHIDVNFRRIDANHFTAIIYIGGSETATCSIGINSDGTFNGIAFSQGRSISRSVNESLSVVDDGYELFLRPMGIFGYSSREKENLSVEGAAEYYWELFIKPLQQ